MKPFWLRLIGWSIVVALLVEHGAHPFNVTRPHDVFFLALGMASYLYVKWAVWVYALGWLVWRVLLRERADWQQLPRYPSPDAGHRWLG